MPTFLLRDGCYLLLLALQAGHGLTVVDDRIVVPDPTKADSYLPVGESDLDELEAHGLIATTGEGTEAGPVVTERGRYWTERWLAAHFRVKGFRLTGVKLSGV